MTDFLPTQEPGPGPTDAPLPTYQSYSAYTTSIYDYTTTITRIAYDPTGTKAPSLVIQTSTERTTSIGYSVVNIPLLYTGPFPAPPLGTLFTTEGQVAQPTPTQASNPAQSIPTNVSQASGSASQTNGGAATPSHPVSPASPSNTGAPLRHGNVIAGSSESTNSNNGGNGGAVNGIQQGQQGGSGSGSGQTSNDTDGQGIAGGGSNQGSGANNSQGSATNGSNNGEGNGNDTGNNSGTGNGSGNSNGGSGSSSANGNNSGNGNGNEAGSNSGNGAENGNGNSSINGIGTPTSSESSNGNGMGPTASQSQTSTPVPTPAPTATSSSPLQSSIASVGSSVSNESANASAESVSASQESVSASNAAASASLASVSATNAAQSSSASVASQSAASAASSASVLSASASQLSASASDASASLTAAYPSSTNNGSLPPNNYLAHNGLSGGQIAGIVLGSVFGLLLLLLLCLLCARRRRRMRAEEAAIGAGGGVVSGGVGRKLSDKWSTGFSRSSGRGTYAALGAGAAAGAGLLAAGERGSVRSDEWEEDRLSGGDGSGFFVVGGKRVGGSGGVDDQAAGGSLMSREERNGAPSGSSSKAGLAGLGAGIAAAFTAGKARRSSGKGKESDHQPVPTTSREADDMDDADEVDGMLGSDEDGGDPNSERRGLMSFGDVGDSSEMTQAGPSGWTRTDDHQGWGADTAPNRAADIAGLGALGAGAMYAAHKSRSSTDQGNSDRGSPSAARNRKNTMTHRNSAGSEPVWFAGGLGSPNTRSGEGGGYSSAADTSNAGHYQSSESGVITGSGTGSRFSGSGSGPNASGNSTGARTEGHSSSHHTGFTSRQQQAASGERPIQTYGNIAPAGYSNRVSRVPSFTGGFGDGDLGLAEEFRDGNPFSEEALIGAGAAGLGLGALAARHRDSGTSTGAGGIGGDNSDSSHEERYSRLISSNTNLLGPGAGQEEEEEEEEQRQGPQESTRDATSSSASSPQEGYRKRSSTFGIDPYTHQSRLSTIKSVGEFGERASQRTGSSNVDTGTGGTGNSGSGSGSGTRSGYGSVNSPPIYTSSAAPSAIALPFSTPLASPLVDQNPYQDQEGEQTRQSHEGEGGTGASAVALGAAAAAAGGFLGGLIPGWTRWGRDTKEEQEETIDDQDQVQPGRAGHQRGQESQPDVDAEVQSQRASVYYHDSNLGHGGQSGGVSQAPSVRQEASGSGSGSGGASIPSRPSKNEARASRSGEGSGSGSGSGAASLPSRPSNNEALAEAEEDDQDQQDIYAQGEEGVDDQDAEAGGYTASVSNQSQNVSSNNNSRSGSRRSAVTTSTGLSRGATSGTGTSNSNSQSNSGTSSNRRNLSSSGGSGSTGAASYNPSYLGRHSTSSTRGGGGGGGANSSSLSSRVAARGGGQSTSSQRRREELQTDNGSSIGGMTEEGESIGESSRATAGGGEDLKRFSMEPGMLGSVREGQEEVLSSSPFYPSESLGAAVRRRAEREAQEQLGGEGGGTRTHPPSLLPGSALHPSSSWRQSPRVQSASERATANLQREQQGGQQQQQQQPGSNYRWTDLRESLQPPQPAGTSSPRRSRIRDPEEGRQQGVDEDDQAEEEGGEEGDSSQDRGLWPKFLRFNQ